MSVRKAWMRTVCGRYADAGSVRTKPQQMRAFLGLRTLRTLICRTLRGGHGRRRYDAARVLLARLDAAGIVASREGDRLRLRGQQPSPDLLAELRERKADLLAEISQRDRDAPEQDHDWSPVCRAIRDARPPLLGTPERTRQDRDQALAVAGLLAG